MTVGELIAKLGDTEAQVRALRAAVVSSAETAEKALERLERAEAIIDRLRYINEHCTVSPPAVARELEELLAIYDEHKPS